MLQTELCEVNQCVLSKLICAVVGLWLIALLHCCKLTRCFYWYHWHSWEDPGSQDHHSLAKEKFTKYTVQYDELSQFACSIFSYYSGMLGLIPTGWHKNFLFTLTLSSINRFSKLITVRIRREFAIILSLKTPSHIRYAYVVTLPCEMSPRGTNYHSVHFVSRHSAPYDTWSESGTERHGVAYMNS